MSLVSYLPYYDALLQNANAVLLQNATKAYYKFRNLFRITNAAVLLKDATVITKYGDFFTKCDSYYEIRQRVYER